MKKLFLAGLIGLSILTFASLDIPNDNKIYELGFTKNYAKIQEKKKISEVLSELSEVTDKNYILINENKDFVVESKRPYRVYNLNDLNKFLIKNGYPHLLKVTKRVGKDYYVKIVPADTLNAYDIKGVRLIKGLKIKDVFKKLNEEKWTQSKYEGKNFTIPANPNIIIKNLVELQKYLNATSNYSIFLKKAVDVNNDNVTDIEIWGQTITMKNKGETPKEAIIRHLEIIKKLANAVKNPNFNKELFKQDIEQTIKELKTLK